MLESNVSTDSGALLARASSVDAACALLDVPPADLCRALIECADHGDWLGLPENARWNLLWVWAELSVEVDLFSARALWSALGRLYHRQLRRLDDSPAVQMVFDFFFHRPAHPLVPLQIGLVLTLLGRLLEEPSEAVQRSALHGLGHLVALLTPMTTTASPDSQDGSALAQVYAAIDRFTPSPSFPSLAAYAQAARSGTVD